MKTQNMVRLSIVALAGVVASQMALAQGVGNVGSLPTQFEMSNPLNGWVVADPSGASIPVSLNPSGPAWSKNFTGPNGGPFSQPALGPALPVQEFLLVSGNLPWTDWHEDVVGIDASGAPDYSWTWANPTLLVGGLPAPGLTMTGAGTSSLSFFFNPLPPGTPVIIRKQLAYNGLPGTAFSGTLAIHEYPTPEPATLALMGIGSLLMWRRRSRESLV
jgi:hypothetical protein